MSQSLIYFTSMDLPVLDILHKDSCNMWVLCLVSLLLTVLHVSFEGQKCSLPLPIQTGVEILGYWVCMFLASLGNGKLFFFFLKVSACPPLPENVTARATSGHADKDNSLKGGEAMRWCWKDTESLDDPMSPPLVAHSPLDCHVWERDLQLVWALVSLGFVTK